MFYDEVEGFGRIFGDNGRTYLVHHVNVEHGPPLRRRERVEFKAVEEPGLRRVHGRAREVRRVS
jgi:hypothetical protein